MPDALTQRIADVVTGMGLELVDVEEAGARDRRVLRVRVDRPGSAPGQGVSTDECARASRALEAVLEAEGLVGPRYVLEVSSPGIERPVRFPAHWRRFVGSRVRLRRRGVPGRPEAEIVAVPDDATVRLRFADGTTEDVALASVREATLVVDWDAILRRRAAEDDA